MPNFEDFLTMKHGEDYIGTDDCMPDAFNDWLEDVSLDDWIIYGDQFGKEQSKELLEALKEIAKGTGAYSRDQLQHATNTIENMKQLAKQAIAKAEKE